MAEQNRQTCHDGEDAVSEETDELEGTETAGDVSMDGENSLKFVGGATGAAAL